MPRRNTTEVAVLGMIALGARTGYDIRQECETKLVHFWSESYGQIYPVLQRLRDRGWVERETVEGKGPEKHVHTLTDEGLARLREWIRSPAEPMRPRNELLLKTFLGRLVELDDLDALLEDHARRARSRRDAYVELRGRIRREAADDPDAPYWLVTLDFGIRSLAAQIEWAEAARDRLRAAGPRPEAAG